MKYDVVIIGSGPAGMSAALYLKRADVSCCIVEHSAPGGQMNKTAIIENYPGLERVTGSELSLKMWKQVMDLKTDYVYSEVTSIEVLDTTKIVHTKEKDITCQFVIIASGRSPRKLGLANEEKLIGKGISYCAVCDGPLYKGKEVVVVGGSDAALEEALYLATICQKVYLIHRRSTYRAKGHLITSVLKTKNIICCNNQVVIDLKEKDGKLDAVISQDVETNEQTTYSVQGAFVFIGHEPNTSFVKALSLPNSSGYIQVDAHFESKIPGIYAVGDVVLKEVFQIITAASEGVTAALAILNKRARG